MSDLSQEGSKVVAFLGSPRQGGNTDILLASVAQGVKEAGCVFETVRLAGMNISPCIGCGGCDKTGRCVIQDEMQGLYDKVLEASAVIIASPIYFYALTAQTKIFIDRMQAMWSRKQLLVAEKKWSVPQNRRGYFVSVAATGGAKIFDGAKLCVQYAYDAMGFHYGADLLVRGVDKRGAINDRPECLVEAVDFGRQICAGLVSAGR